VAKIVLEFEGSTEHLQMGIKALARTLGWQVGSEEDPLTLARTALGKFTRDAVLRYQKEDADVATQVAVDAAVAQKEATLAAIETGTLEALDAVTLSVLVVPDE
jgi:hypothetical protein